MAGCGRDADYWKSYRKIRANVVDHINFIYQPNTRPSNNQDDSNITQPECENRSFENEHVACSSNVASNQEDACMLDVESDIDDFNVGSDTSSITEISSTIDSSEEIDDDHDSRATSSSDEDIGHTSLADELASWVSKFNIAHSAVYELLHILSKFHQFLPKDPRTLLNTRKTYEISEIAGGSYHHFGLKMGISNIITNSKPELFNGANTLLLHINIDGLPLFKSSNVQFWPILGRIVDPFLSDPFIIGLYLGDNKPTDVHIYLQNFIDEVQDLEQNLLHIPDMGLDIQVSISCVICDTPARCFVKKTKGHSGYHGCDKCMQRGTWVGKMTFPDINSTLRTDIAFDEMEDEPHHKGPSPFSNLQIGLVTQFPLDYMHLVCLGLMKRLLMLWIKGPLENSCRMSARTIGLISQNLVNLSKHLPREFLRKGRSLHYIERWKASEFRQFLLYTGPIVLKDCLPRLKYQHFLLFFVAIYCLSSPVFFREYGEYAHDILCIFVRDVGRLYGRDQIVYNIHGLTHLIKDVERFGPLDRFSAFIFESFLGRLKRLVRKPNFPLQQVIRRLSECNYQFEKKSEIPKLGIPKKIHIQGPRSADVQFRHFLQFKDIHFQDLYFSVSEGDNCILVGNKVGIIKNIICQNAESEKYVIYKEFRNTSDFFSIPLNSSDLGIYTVCDLAGELKTDKCSVVSKCVLMPFDEKFVAIPLIHTS